MGRFKEQGKEGIREMQENSKETTERGNEMNQQAEQIKSILESIELQDDEDMEAVSETGRNYQGSFDSAFTAQVEEIGQQGEQLKGEMNQELENVRSGMSRLEQAGGVSEIGRDAAEAGRSKLESSSQEYEGMIEDTESVVDETEEKINSLKNNLSRIFG